MNAAPRPPPGRWRSGLALAAVFVAVMSGSAKLRADAPEERPTAQPAAQAQSAGLEQYLQTLARGDLASLREAITGLAGLGDPRALPLLEALQKRKLKISPELEKVFLRRGTEYVEALGGAAAPEGATLQSPVVNNVVRRVLKPALAGLRLRAPDREVRLEAAKHLADAPVAGMRAAIAQAIAEETDAAVREHLSVAVARLDLAGGNDEQTLAAIRLVAESGDLALKGDLERVALDTSRSEHVVKLATSTLRGIETKQTLVRFVGDLFYGVSLGSILILAALGLAITFGLMGVINMAHGEMLMLGAYATYVVQGLFQEHAPGAQGWYLLVAIPTAFLFCTLVGIGLERGVIRFLYGRPLETLLATWGISLGLIQTVRLTFGAQNVAVASPQWLAGGYEVLEGVVLPYSRIAIVLFTVAVVSFLWLVLNRTRLGLNVRAVTQNREMADAIGIRSARVDMWTFGLGSGLAGLGGVALSQVGNVGPELGQGYIVDSFMVVVLGGVGKLAGTVFGALGIGMVNKVIEPISGAVFGKILVLLIIIMFIQRRPQGLFAVRGRALEG